MNYKKIGLILGAGTVLGTSSAFANLVITPTFDSTITSNGSSAQIQATINQAIAFYNANFTDNITVAIKFQLGGGLGSNSSYYQFKTYASVRTALGADATSADDTTAMSFLATGAVNPVTAGANMALTNANARALGYTVAFGNGGSDPFDSTVTLNTSICNLVHGTNTNSGFYDLYAVVSHEIDEALGTSSLAGDPFGSGRTNVADMYRYNNGARTWDTNNGHAAFFSINGTTNIVEYNALGQTGGDWGDWIHHNGAPQVQDFSGTPGVTVDMGPSELRLLDVVGYNRAAAVPEPNVILGLGLGAVALIRRRKK